MKYQVGNELKVGSINYIMEIHFIHCIRYSKIFSPDTPVFQYSDIISPDISIFFIFLTNIQIKKVDVMGQVSEKQVNPMVIFVLLCRLLRYPITKTTKITLYYVIDANKWIYRTNVQCWFVQKENTMIIFTNISQVDETSLASFVSPLLLFIWNISWEF